MQGKLVLGCLLFFAFCIFEGQTLLFTYDWVEDRSDNMTDTGLDVVPTVYQIHYSVRPPIIEIGIVCNSSSVGWCAFGISPDGFMLETDAMIGWMDPQGNANIQDWFIYGRFPATSASCSGSVCPDFTQGGGCANQFVLRNMSRSGPILTIEYTRPLIASDACDRPITPDSPVFVVYSIGVPVAGSWPYNLQKHNIRTLNTPDSITFHSFPPTTGAGTTGTTATTAPSGTTATTTAKASTTAKGTTAAPITTATTNAATTGTTAKPATTATTATVATTTAAKATTAKAATTAASCQSTFTAECTTQCGTSPVVSCQCLENGSVLVQCGSSSSGNTLLVFTILVGALMVISWFW